MDTEVAVRSDPGKTPTRAGPPGPVHLPLLVHKRNADLGGLVTDNFSSLSGTAVPSPQGEGWCPSHFRKGGEGALPTTARWGEGFNHYCLLQNWPPGGI